MSRPPGQSEFELDRLKELLLRPETDRLGAVEARLEGLDQRVGTPDRLETATSDILVEAFRRAEIARHRELAGAVAPVVVAAIRNEIKNSKDMMVEALYPITGRLVAAAVANAFRDLVADLNERLDRTLSTRHWTLRFQSIMTGRPMSELALAEAQRPVLRRLLLLERGSGRLFAAWNAEGEGGEQSELVSGLIAAITEFASSVYGARSGELRTLDLGDARVFLRGAPLYLIAAECAGALKPEHERELDDAFLSLVSRVDQAPDKASPALAQMAESLFRQQSPARKKSSLPLILIAGALVALAAWWASGPVLRGLHERRIEKSFAAAIAAQPGLDAFPLKVSVDHAAGAVTIAGLAPSDAAATSVAAAVATAAAPYKVVAHTASVGAVAQLQDMRRRENELAAAVSKIDQRIAALENLEADDRAAVGQTAGAVNALRAETTAAAGKLAALVAASAPTPRDRTAALVASRAIYFSQSDTFVDAALAARRIDEIVAALRDGSLSLHVIGHADSSGGEKRNRMIAQARADAVVALLTARGIDPARLRAIARPSVSAGGVDGDPRDRRVTFELAPDDETGR